MKNTLEEYLEEISHYLVVSSGADEILKEIKSHIMEETEECYGDTAPENLEQTIARYGNPRKVAERYLEGNHIIAPSFRKYLFRYTWILFAIHFGLTCIFFLLKTNLQMFPPLFSIPHMTNIFSLLNQIPMTFIYDFGLVALLLFFISQSKKDIRLPWVNFMVPKKGEKKFQPPKPKSLYLLLEVAGSGVLLFLFLSYGTIFFKSLNLDTGLFQPWLSSPASHFYSVVILIWCGLEIFFYAIRFFKNTFFVRLVKNLVYLVGLWLLMNIGVEGELIDVGFMSLYEFKNGVILLLAVMIFLETMSNIYKMIRNKRLSRP